MPTCIDHLLLEEDMGLVNISPEVREELANEVTTFNEWLSSTSLRIPFVASATVASLQIFPFTLLPDTEVAAKEVIARIMTNCCTSASSYADWLVEHGADLSEAETHIPGPTLLGKHAYEKFPADQHKRAFLFSEGALKDPLHLITFSGIESCPWHTGSVEKIAFVIFNTAIVFTLVYRAWLSVHGVDVRKFEQLKGENDGKTDS